MNAVLQQQHFTPEEQLDRRNWIGGSDAAAAINMNPYRSPYDLWQEKLGLVPPFEGNEATLWGKLHEPVIRQQYAERTGNVVRLPEGVIKHPTIPFAAVHPDGIVPESKRLYEGKTARYSDGWGQDGTDEVPQHYLIQCQHGMGCLGYDVTDLAVLIGGSELRIYTIEADKELQALIFAQEAKFWDCVRHNIPPALDVTRHDAVEVLKRMYPGTDGTSVDATEQAIAARMQYEEQGLIEKNAKALKEEAKAIMLNLMGGSTYLRFLDGKSFRRAIVNREAYTVAASSYIDGRIIKSK